MLVPDSLKNLRIALACFLAGTVVAILAMVTYVLLNPVKHHEIESATRIGLVILGIAAFFVVAGSVSLGVSLRDQAMGWSVVSIPALAFFSLGLGVLQRWPVCLSIGIAFLVLGPPALSEILRRISLQLKCSDSTKTFRMHQLCFVALLSSIFAGIALSAISPALPLLAMVGFVYSAILFLYLLGAPTSYIVFLGDLLKFDGSETASYILARRAESNL